MLLLADHLTSSVSLCPVNKLLLPLTATLHSLLRPQDAFAAGGEFGILEGRSLALILLVVMGGLFLYTLYGMAVVEGRYLTG
ncbi:hypothetical protein R6Q59_021596 [Mikania micrantha]